MTTSAIFVAGFENGVVTRMTVHKPRGKLDMLIVRADRRELLVVIPLTLAAEIAAIAEHGRAR